MEKNRNDDRFYNREKLYTEIWNEPILKVAKRYSVSDVALAKTCRKLGIPLPGVGYWAKKQYGKEPPTPPLPEMETVLQILKRPVPNRQYGKDENISKMIAAKYPEIQRLIGQEELPEFRIDGNKQSAFHPLIENTNKLLRQEFKKKQYYWVDRRITVRDSSVFNVKISEDSLERAIRLLDTFVKALEKRGFSVQSEKNEYREMYTRIHILGNEIPVRLFEASHRKMLTKLEKEKENTYHNYILEPDGKLSFEIYSRQRFNTVVFQDRKTDKLEKRLNEIMIFLYKECIYRAEEKIRREEHARVAAIEEAFRQTRREIRNKVERRVSMLHEEAKSLEEYNRLRTYVKSVEREASKLTGKTEEYFQIITWLDWANEYLKMIDPMRNGLPKYD